MEYNYIKRCMSSPIKSDGLAGPSHRVAHVVLYVIGAWYVANDLHTFVPWSCTRVYWRQFAARRLLKMWSRFCHCLFSLFLFFFDLSVLLEQTLSRTCCCSRIRWNCTKRQRYAFVPNWYSYPGNVATVNTCTPATLMGDVILPPSISHYCSHFFG